MDFKEQVILARARLDLSQEGLAKLLNVSFATVNRWEQGHTQPTKKAKIAFLDFCRKTNALQPQELQEATNNQRS
jgi:putative transcriptional regulator